MNHALRFFRNMYCVLSSMCIASLVFASYNEHTKASRPQEAFFSSVLTPITAASAQVLTVPELREVAARAGMKGKSWAWLSKLPRSQLLDAVACATPPPDAGAFGPSSTTLAARRLAAVRAALLGEAHKQHSMSQRASCFQR